MTEASVIFTPEKSKKIALARLDLLINGKSFVKNQIINFRQIMILLIYIILVILIFSKFSVKSVEAHSTVGKTFSMEQKIIQNLSHNIDMQK